MWNKQHSIHLKHAKRVIHTVLYMYLHPPLFLVIFCSYILITIYEAKFLCEIRIPMAFVIAGHLIYFISIVLNYS